jgi:hypothetical protein
MKMKSTVTVSTYTIEGKIYADMEQLKSLFEWDLDVFFSENTLESRKGIQHCIDRIQGMLEVERVS